MESVATFIKAQLDTGRNLCSRYLLSVVGGGVALTALVVVTAI